MNFRNLIHLAVLTSVLFACDHSDLEVLLSEACEEGVNCTSSEQSPPVNSDNAEPESRLEETDTDERATVEADEATNAIAESEAESDFDESDLDVADEDETTDLIEDNGANEPTDPITDDLRIQVIGDSHLAWNDEMSTGVQIGDVLRERGLDVTLQNNAINGATLGCGEGGIGSADNCIPPQFENGEWTHVVLSGGGNDFLESQCGIRVDDLMTVNFTGGRMVELIERMRRVGIAVVIVGYVSPLDPLGEAGSCNPLKTLLNRYRDFASATQGVSFVDTRLVFGPDQPSMYADDVHTSVEGSRRLAEVIADQLIQ